MFNRTSKKVFFIISILIISLAFLIYKKKKENVFIQIIKDLNIEKIPDTKVFIALDPECPLSQSYTKKINDLFKKYKEQVLFIGFFPGSYYSDQEINSFKEKYNLNIKSFIDKKLTLTKTFNADVVPEVFVLNNDYKIIYNGLIDNWVGEIGKKKQYINKEYLIDAIESSLNNELPLIRSTKAIGCLIEK